jgi:hypothetical protein
VHYEYKEEDLTALLYEGLQRDHNMLNVTAHIQEFTEQPSAISETENIEIRKLQNAIICEQVLTQCAKARRQLVKRDMNKRKNGRVCPENEYISQWKLK